MESRDIALELGGYTAGIGLGLRAAIPKMPSFRKKRKIPSPVVMDEDSSKRLSDQVKPRDMCSFRFLLPFNMVIVVDSIAIRITSVK